MPSLITKEDRIGTGVVDYFRNALAAVGRHSRLGNEKYPPADGSKDLRWSFDVSTNHADAILSHLSQRGEIDPETGYSHTVALAWRALALLETELVEQGAKPGRAVVRSTKEKLKDLLVRTPSGAHVLVSHPAQLLAVEAFKAEQSVGEQLAEAGYDRFAALKGGSDD